MDESEEETIPEQLNKLPEEKADREKYNILKNILFISIGIFLNFISFLVSKRNKITVCQCSINAEKKHQWTVRQRG